MPIIEGVFPALLTTFDENGIFCPARYSRFIDHLYERGVHGLYVCGVTGEGLLMSVEEREQAAEVAVETSRGRGKALVHVGCANTADAVHLTRHAVRIGAAGIGALAPYVGWFDSESLIQHFQAIADAAQDLPALIYYTPHVARSLSDYRTLERLLEIPNVAGVKLTATDPSEFATVIAEYGRKRIVLSGIDELFAGALFMGAHGAVGSFVNVLPDSFVEIFSLARDRRWQEAQAIQNRIIHFIRIVERYPFISALKHVVARQGLNCGNARPPQQQLSPQQVEDMFAALGPVYSTMVNGGS
jgi:N-acetylneuraminate lyase